DGRVADVAETGFLGGQLVVPQFMLKELQQVADSADSAKRNRGRRGLDILQRIQKNHNLDVQVSDIDFPDIREVDHKLIELAKQLNGKIVTNDFNLNKVAQLRGVAVLNINELANALKPVVLPGELMKVFVLKEGKEYNQGVAYLDDGTMVVIDNARRSIGKNVEISVTSVLQTTAGKMIFGRYAGEDGRSTPPDGRVITDRTTPPDGRIILEGRSIHHERSISPDVRNIAEGRDPRDVRSSSPATPISPNSTKFRVDG
ncbi:MAG: Integral membrane protein, partial [bacterium]